MTFKSSSLAKIAKEYAIKNALDVEDYVFDHLNDRMKKAVEVFKHQSYDTLIVALVPLMSEQELEKLGEYLLKERLIHEYKNCYYFEIPEGITYNGAIFNC